MRLAQKSAKNVCQVICFQCRFLRLGSIPLVYNPYPSLTSKRHNNIIVLVIATFNEDGFLPPGIHWTDWPEFVQRFGLTTHRNKLIQGLVESSQKLASAGCRAIYIDGSFVTSKEHPGDFDACWDLNNVDVDNLDPIFFDFANRRAAQKARFFGEWFPADLPNGNSGLTFLEFFQLDKPTGKPKGIIAIALAKGQKE